MCESKSCKWCSRSFSDAPEPGSLRRAFDFVTCDGCATGARIITTVTTDEGVTVSGRWHPTENGETVNGWQIYPCTSKADDIIGILAAQTNIPVAPRCPICGTEKLLCPDGHVWKTSGDKTPTSGNAQSL